MISYFFDTYAMVEIIFANENYARKTSNVSIITTKMNLLELHHHILNRHGSAAAQKAYDAFKEGLIESTDEDIIDASTFRKSHASMKLSFIDCLGYAMAKRRGMKFLTGDSAFKGLENVEFVK